MKRGCLWLVGILVVLGVLGAIFGGGSKQPSAGVAVPTQAAVAATVAPSPTKVALVPTKAPIVAITAAPVLSLVSTSGSVLGTRWFVVQGMVKNLTDQPIPNVAAVVIIDGAADEAMISYNPINAGETSPFKVMVARETPAAAWQVQFKQIGKGSLPSN